MSKSYILSVMKKKVCIVKKSAENSVYRFNPVGDRDGKASPYHKAFEDNQDFTINPLLMKEIGFEKCHETTPEGKALWLYMRLCLLLKYDEGIFFSEHRSHPNDDARQSFKIVSEVTAETPTTCFNFARIAVKLLNQIQGVHALMITVGYNDGHFRFGYYTDKVTVDAEPSSPHHHYNDMARVKLGLAPTGLNVLHGTELMQDLEQRIVPQMLPKLTPDLREQLAWLYDETKLPQPDQIKIKPLIEGMRKNGIDGATALQVLIDLNKHYEQKPYKFLRAGMIHTPGVVEPQLLVRKYNRLARLDLTEMELSDLPIPVFDKTFTRGEMVYANEEIDNYLEFACGLSAEQERLMNS